MSFRGNLPTRVDEKGRLKLPAGFRHLVDDLYKSKEFYMTSRDGERMEIYPLAEWEKYEAKLLAMPTSHPVRMRLMRKLSYYGLAATMDDQGRLLIPQLFRDDAQMTGDVMVLGMVSFLEVSRKVTAEADKEPLTDEDNLVLSQYGL